MVIDRYLSANLAALDPRFQAFLRPDGTLVVRLLKALYGTVEASRLWYDVITGLMLKAGFVPNPIEPCVLNRRRPGGKQLTVVLYVDDLLVMSEDESEILWFKAHLEEHFPEVTFHSGSILDYVGMTLDFASSPGRLVVTMKQSIDDIISTSTVSAPQPTPATATLFDVDPTSRSCPALGKPISARSSPSCCTWGNGSARRF